MVLDSISMKTTDMSRERKRNTLMFGNAYVLDRTERGNFS